MSKNILIKNEHGYSLELSEWRKRYPEFDIFSYYTETYPDIISIQVNEKELPGVLYVGGRLAESKCITIYELLHSCVETVAVVNILIDRMCKDVMKEREKRTTDYYNEWYDTFLEIVTEFRKTDEVMKDFFATVIYDYELWKNKKEYRLDIAEKSHLVKFRDPIHFFLYISHEDLIDPRFKNTYLKDYMYFGVNEIINERNGFDVLNNIETFAQQVERNINSIPFGFNPTITVKKED